MFGGGSVPVCSGIFAPGCCFGHNSGGEGVEVGGINYVAHLVLGLKDDTCFNGCVHSFQEKKISDGIYKWFSKYTKCIYHLVSYHH